MLLVINLSKEIEDADQAQHLVNLVAERLNDHHEVHIDAHVAEHLIVPEPPE